MDIRLTSPQFDFLKLDATYCLFVGGYGSGKTYAKIVIAITDLLNNPGCNIGMYDPIYDLVRLNTAPRTLEMLSDMGLECTYNKSESIIAVHGYGNIVMRSMDNPARIVGYEVFRSAVDEIETMRPAQAEEAWNKIIARNRQKSATGQKNQVRVYTTPDAGFGFTYKKWGKDKRSEYEYIRAPTHSNKYLPADYIDNLRSTYPPNMVEAFIEGVWCNLNSGSVYPDFDRRLNHTNAELRPNEAIHAGADFNVVNGTLIIAVIRDGLPIIVDEITGIRDTPTMVRILKDRYPGHSITIYPDASGQARKSVNASESDLSILRQGGFTVRVESTNPAVKDRVNAMNAMILNGEGKRRLLVNTDRCPKLTEALEQQAYDDSGMPDKTTGHDHITDATGYLILNRYPIRSRGVQKTQLQGV